MTVPTLRIGARASALSVAQTQTVRAALAAALGAPVEALPLLTMTTTGDQIQDRRLIEAGGKGLFTKELDDALLDGRIDVAVHSLKDLPTVLPDGIVLAAVTKRADARDALISGKAARLQDLPEGAVLGTASLRRQAQALYLRPDLKVEMLRGNVETRLRKVREGGVDATFLALAGLSRLGLAHEAAGFTDPEEMPPAAGQGALAITARAGDEPSLAAAALVADAATTLAAAAERAFLGALDGSCRTPIAAYATLDGASMAFLGETLTPDGKNRWRRKVLKPVADEAAAAALGREAGLSIREEAGALLVADA